MDLVPHCEKFEKQKMFAHKWIHNDFADNWIHNDEFGFWFASHFAQTQHMSHNILLASDDGKVWSAPVLGVLVNAWSLHYLTNDFYLAWVLLEEL